MVRLYLVRHGEVAKEGIDPGLSMKGKQQAKRVAGRLAQLPITKAYVSSARRAVETYEPYHKLQPEVPGVISEQLKEIYRMIIGGPERLGTSPDRELHDTKRAGDILQEILDHAKDDDNIVLFIHGNFIRYLLAHFLQISKINLWERLEIHEASISLIEITNSEPRVKAINVIEHLDKKDVDAFYKTPAAMEYLS